MSVNDGAMYTGVDEPVGQFGNEQDPATKELLDKEREKVQRLIPQLESLIEDIDSEIKSVMSIDRFITAAGQPDTNIRAELQAAALYKDYLDQLKTKFTLTLRATRGRD